MTDPELAIVIEVGFGLDDWKKVRELVDVLLQFEPLSLELSS